jgi:hypothetical protein
VTSTEAALGLALANQAAAVVPPGLAASVTSGALAGTVWAGTAAAGGGAAVFMGATKLTVGLIGAAAVAGIGVAWWGTSRAEEARAELAVATQEQATLGAKLGNLETRVQTETKRLQTAETENARLLALAEKMKAAAVTAPAEAEPVTSGMVQARWKRARELAMTGDPAEALREVLWCYDVGMPQISSMSAVRGSSGASVLAKLGERYPPALDALRERRDQARARVMASEDDFAAVQELGAINRALKDDAANIALYDQLPAGDRRRGSLASNSYDYLVANQRYRDAVVGLPYPMIISLFAATIEERPLPASIADPERIRSAQRKSAIDRAAMGIEALAGAGDLTNARKLAERVLAYDATEATRALIQQRIERAGQPGLLAPTTNP